MMKNKRKLRYLATAVSALLCVAALSTVNYATSQDNEPPITSKPEITSAVTTAAKTTTATETTTPPSDFSMGTPFSEGGIAATRDLLYDANTNKQYITVETRNGHMLYIIIDYDKPLDDEEERYQVYFLNPVDESDLLALLEDEDIEIPAVVCTCTDKCAAGNVNADCELCKNNISNCAGKEAATDEPEKTEQTAEESGDSSNGNMTNIIILVVVVSLVGGAAILLLKFRKTKAKPNVRND